MASACYNQWRKHTNSKGISKWVNEGPAPDGACPSCPDMVYPTLGTWDGVSAICVGGAIRKLVANGTGGQTLGDIIHAVGTPQATQACSVLGGFIGTGSLSDYF